MGGDRKARAGRKRDRYGNNGGASEDGGRKAEGDNAMGDRRTTEVGSCRDAAENGRDTESTGDGGRRQRQETGTGPSVPKKWKMEDKVSFCLNYNGKEMGVDKKSF